MLNFKIAVSKDGKKYNIVFKAENEAVARERVHNEWYSILSLELVTDKHDIWDTFVFEWYKWWEFKHWKIVWNDIFKAYVKLRKDLEYDIQLIYSENDENFSIEKKLKIIEELKEEYDLYYSSWKKEKIDEIRDKIKKEKEENKKLENFYLKKELEDVNKLLEIVLLKLEKMISGQWIITIDQIKAEKLKIIYNEIIKLKKSTNISKLREVWELALLKIWNIELQEVEKTKNKENIELLKETNKLLKKIWSKDQFREKEKDLVYQFNFLVSNIRNFFTEIKNERKKNNKVDKESHSYIKTLLYLSKYKDYYKENTKLIIKNFYKFFYDKEFIEELFLTRSVIKQNIILLKAKEKWLNISYTYLKKGINKIIDAFIWFFQLLNKYIFFIILMYTTIFIIYLNIWFYIDNLDYNYNGIFYFLIAIFIYLFIYLSRSLFFLIINFVFLFFIIILGVINF